MVARKLLAVALAATLLIGGVAATGAATPQDTQPGNDSVDDDRGPADDAPPDNTTQYEPGDDNDSAADRGNGSAADRGNAPDDVGPDAERGPPVDMPGNVPDHVSQIHQQIDEFLSGDVDDLGSTLSELLGGADDGEESDDAEAADEADADDGDDSDDEDAEESADDDDDADEDADA